METIKNRLLKALSMRSMTPAELARESGINKSTISRYLSGKVEPKQSAIFAMAKVLDVSPSWLLGINNDYVIVTDDLKAIIEQLTPQDKETLKAIAETLLNKSKESGDDNTKV